MDNEIKIFENEEFGSVRTMEINGEPYFVGKDVATILGYAKPENAIANHVDTEDKTLTLIQGGCSTGSQKTTVINESGLYSLILSSKLPNAKKFKRWVHLKFFLLFVRQVDIQFRVSLIVIQLKTLLREQSVGLKNKKKRRHLKLKLKHRNHLLSMQNIFRLQKMSLI